MKDSKVYTHLVNNGPTPSTDLPLTGSVSPAMRDDGFRKFRIPGGPGDIDSRPGTNQTWIYYLDGKHSPRTILEAWVDANPSAVQNSSAWSIHQSIARNYPEFKPASRNVFGPFTEKAPNNDQKESPGLANNPCPFCGAEDIPSFPAHRSECPEL